MKSISSFLLLLLPLIAQATHSPQGKISERPRYGTNYTVPFAHAYRALGKLGEDCHDAIDRDVYHFARLGFDAFRLHLWDVELSDASGNLQENEHLELLDYLIDALEKRGIDIVLTAQTNFGNGYPERNTNPYNAFSYDYSKCEVHDNPIAQQAQQRYIPQLVRHVNPYTGRSIADDPSIIAIEINNEPCHSGNEDEITAYINLMAETLRKNGWGKDILYNVSHNLWRTSAFYNADIDGTTYQWYPTGLVKGERRRGNFLPVLDEYNIPFDTIPGYERMSRVIYEYDPADVLDSYLYPAAARSFRKAGFDWITQFAYDPIDMAAYNTEYQTHFLNLAYTPGKAIGMMIAAEVARRTPRGKNYGNYPRDTIFGEKGEFLVSARRDLAMLNDSHYYLYSNNTGIQPVEVQKLRHIAGTGSSPLITSDGTGAYFLDNISEGVWRLELMPDVYLTADPFCTPSLNRTVGRTIERPINMSLNLPQLGKIFTIKNVLSGDICTTDNGTLSLMPGVWLLGDAKAIATVNIQDSYNGGRLKINEYVAPKNSNEAGKLIHKPIAAVNPGEDIVIEAVFAGNTQPDSIVVYPSDVNFWNDRNRLYSLRRNGFNTYSCTISSNVFSKRNTYLYNIVTFERNSATTWPANTPGTPLDWDYNRKSDAYYIVEISEETSPASILDVSKGLDGMEISTVPEAWGGIHLEVSKRQPVEENRAVLRKDADVPTEHILLTKRVAETTVGRRLTPDSRIIMRLGKAEGIDSITLNVVSLDGFTYSAPVAVKGKSHISVALKDLNLSPTWLTPTPYPGFLGRQFVPDANEAPDLNPMEIENVVLDVPAPASALELEIIAAYIQP